MEAKAVMSIASQVLTGINDIRTAQETSAFRGTVIDSLNAIKEGIEDLKNQLDGFEKTYDFWKQWEAVGYPITNMQLKWDEYDSNTQPEDTTDDCNLINTYMHAIHQAVCGEVTGFGKAIDLYLDRIIDSDFNTSIVEKAYSYYGYILTSLVRGYSMLGDYGDSRFGTWHDLFVNGNPDGEKEYQKQPYLAYMGQKCQESIDALAGGKSWAGQTDTHFYSYDAGSFLVDSSLNVPVGSVLSGIDFRLNGDGALIMQGWAGEMDTKGYISAATRFLSTGGSVKSGVNGAFSVETGEITIPDGHVVIDATWSYQTGYALQAYEQIAITVFFPKLKHAPLLDNGTIDIDNAVWTTKDYNLPAAGDLPNKRDYSPSLPDTLEGNTNSKEWTHWSEYDSDTPPDLWNTPITGIQIYDKKATFRASFHKESFGLD